MDVEGTEKALWDQPLPPPFSQPVSAAIREKLLRMEAIAAMAHAMRTYDADTRDVYWALETGGERGHRIWQTLAELAFEAVEKTYGVEK